MRGACEYKLGEIDSAIRDYSTEIALNPGHVMGYLNRGVAYGEKKNFRAAINDMTTIIQNSPAVTQAYLYRGTYYFQAGIKDSACQDFQMAKKLKAPEADQYIKHFCEAAPAPTTTPPPAVAK